jgi:ubiquinone/menaquinone biosynthesis C-methylase UbiE
MSEPYATIADADPLLQERLAEVLELRARDSQQQAMLRANLSEIELPPGARALEIGCGTGAVSRALVESLHCEVSGVDPWCFTRPSVTCRIRRRRFAKPIAYFVGTVGWPYSMATI